MLIAAVLVELVLMAAVDEELELDEVLWLLVLWLLVLCEEELLLEDELLLDDDELAELELLSLSSWRPVRKMLKVTAPPLAPRRNM